MRSRISSITLGAVALAAFGATFMLKWSDSHAIVPSASTAAAEDAPPLPLPVEDNAVATPAGAEVLAQGPVHEAFANPVDANPQPGPIVVKRPPDPVEEIPPEQQPEGDSIVWIPGYWAWDDDRTDFLWVSGVLRNAPPGQTWVPGYWSEVNGGYQWTPGFWTAAAKEEVQYLPAPPQSLDMQAATPAPGENYFWIPGCWLYQDHYAWRPGYWTACRPNWIWNPAHYVWTPGGFVFVDGYWDYAIARRGCLFAPVYFNQPLYARAGFVWTPSVLINVGLFTDHLFVRPSYCHYYFGDYYAARYASIGFQPWFSIGVGAGRRYDPLFTYYRWNNSRTDRNWLAHTQQHFDDLRRNESARPPHTFVAQESLLKRGGDKTANTAVVQTISQVAKDPGQNSFKFHKVSAQDQQSLAVKGKELQQVSQQRVEIEKSNKAGANFGSGGTGVAAGDQNSKTGTAVAKGWKLPTAASSKITLSAQNQGNGTTGNNGANFGNFQQKNGRTSGITNNAENNSLNSTGRGGQNGVGTGNGNQNNSGNNVLNGNRSKNNLGQGNSGAGSTTNQGGSSNSNQSGNTNTNRVFVPPAGNGRSGGVQSGNGAQSTIQLPSGGNSQFGAGAGVRGGIGSGGGGGGGNGNPTLGNSSLGNLPRFGNGSQSGGSFQSGGNSTGDGAAVRSFTNPSGRSSGASGGASGGSGNNSGGGSTNKGSGGNQGGGRDDKNKNSYNEQPRTDMNLSPNRSSVVDVPNVMKKDRSMISQTMETPAEMTTRDIKDAGKIDLGRDDFTVDRGSQVATNRDRSVPNQSLDRSRIQLPTTTFRLRSLASGGADGLLGTDNRGAMSHEGFDKLRGEANGKNQSGDRGTNSSDESNGKSLAGNSSPTGTGSKLTTTTPDPRLGSRASLSKYNYQNLRDRGRSLSDRVSLDQAGNGSPTESPDVNTLRRVKDPVASVGMKGTGDRTVYGPGGTDGSPAPSSSLGLDDRSGGLGSYVPPTSLPRMSHFDTRLDRRSTPMPTNDPSARTYDPSRGGY